MNPDEIRSLVALLVTLLAPLAAKYGFSVSDLTALLIGGTGVAYGVISHWNMKKVGETAQVVPATQGAVKS